MSLGSPLTLELSNLRHEETDLIAVEFGDRGDAVNVLDEVFRCAQEGFERSLAIAATEHVAVRRDDHLDEPGSGPVFIEQASEDRLEVIADVDHAKLSSAVLANLVWFADEIVVSHDVKSLVQ